ncbi:MAG: type II toxin-antitoxin system RelE/ParE family toxin [bacterium]
MRVVWTQEALDRLSDIEDFISQDSPQRAARFVSYLIEKGESVSENPRIGRILPEISNPNIREIIAKKQSAKYRIDKCYDRPGKQSFTDDYLVRPCFVDWNCIF